jgi:hypothetical protein
MTRSGSSVYVTYPGYENHSLNMPGKKSIKVGICQGNPDGQAYVNKRYGQSRLHSCMYKRRVDFDTMKMVERRVLSKLQALGYRRQHGKKEHFIIPNRATERKKFVDHVQALYNSYFD